ncbi:hypothetical protein FVR03_17585 [Pontibacter qinzhouensis]|uniref:Lipoprotein n=1 Tax=Pontibacter qinzhouensis TaxID=2603253 RepID=A0A5C8JDR5_9BACT|nr:hypothetical protein [Pontibacter qinzhouensis]TXK36520.1 hypothetical protein FVR03_17585 [Pontibacter qinzhouensis]
MKPTIYLALLYLCLSLLVISCTEDAPAPTACIQAEVVGTDCETGWYVLRLLNDNYTPEKQSGCFVGQIHGGFVTTDNLPDAYKKGGLHIEVALELNSEYSPRCETHAVMLPAVRITQICQINEHITGQPLAFARSPFLSKLARCLS